MSKKKMTRRLILKLFSVTILLATFSACESEFDTQFKQNFIRFSTDEITTKGSLINKFPEGGTFGVSGYCFVNGGSGSADWNSKKARAKPDIFYNQSVTYTTAQGCDYNPPASWSGDTTDKYSFFAYYPYNATGITLSPKTQAGAPTLTYTMPFTSNKTETMLDIKAVPDVMVAKSIDHTSNRGKVNFQFTHMLTTIDFAVNNFMRKDIIITSVKVYGTFNKTAQINMETGDAKVYDEYKGTFEIMDKPKTIKPNRESGPTYLINDAGDNYLLLVPQTLSSNDYKDKKWRVKITYKLDKRTYTEKFTMGEKGKTVSYSAGTRYTFTFDFK